MTSSATGEPTGYPPTQAPYESRTVGATSPKTGRGSSAVPAPASLELTKEDKQEGYDISLLNLPERNTAAAPPADRNSSSALAADLPYASRQRDSSFDRSDGARESFGSGKEGLTGGTTKKTVRHHSSSKDHHRSAPKRGGSRSRRKGKKLKWWQKPITLVAILLLVIVVGVAVGLGVGLGVKKKGGSSSSTTASPAGPTIEPSTSGAGRTVQVSASAAPSPSVRPAGSGPTETVAPGRLARRTRARD
ncbi:hypothetical protein NBRC10512_001862 [Rhodotorula toruloides]|uniref:RHTO0S19e01464g1_1 n=2 Tax=Rhodotorula toruloides TaxID=5286 RepID=A0A061BH19_RHOTO|nr:uncharacterized protein RHTO_03702 [Rhodotorula toruloides NP11]EMS20168.1 hypothetical protein RHTO_03702 [Rhodotorula toruloides NP11]KAJ8292013.1 hypothetical protein OF846_004795 [Rhodotorula toruloides]CDR48644.1 RHTO0S19e01464g1_1 [Rhodotorula toruloides]